MQKIALLGLRKFWRHIQNSNKSKKAFKHSRKDWWDDVAYNKWQKMHHCEREFLKYARSQMQKTLREKFIFAQYDFDKYIKRRKRQYLRNKVNEIETANVNDPVAFWEFIKNLSPRRKAEIPWETVGEDGQIIMDRGEVLDI